MNDSKQRVDICVHKRDSSDTGIPTVLLTPGDIYTTKTQNHTQCHSSLVTREQKIKIFMLYIRCREKTDLKLFQREDIGRVRVQKAHRQSCGTEP